MYIYYDNKLVSGWIMRVISGTAKGTKLESIDSFSTRPTLDRVKESLFNIISNNIYESNILDMFAGSGAIGIEFLSRGCNKAVLCDQSIDAIKIINKNLEKTHLKDKAIVLNMDYKKCLKELSDNNEKFNVIFIDPPYKNNIATNTVELILKYGLLEKDGIIIIETDEQDRDIKQLEKLDIEIYDTRKYGRAHLIFLVERS